MQPAFSCPTSRVGGERDTSSNLASTCLVDSGCQEIKTTATLETPTSTMAMAEQITRDKSSEEGRSNYETTTTGVDNPLHKFSEYVVFVLLSTSYTQPIHIPLTPSPSPHLSPAPNSLPFNSQNQKHKKHIKNTEQLGI
jgi:hypothetical protein